MLPMCIRTMAMSAVSATTTAKCTTATTVLHWDSVHYKLHQKPLLACVIDTHAGKLDTGMRAMATSQVLSEQRWQ